MESEESPANQQGFPDRDYSAINYDSILVSFYKIIAKYGVDHDGDILSAAVLAYGSVMQQWRGSTVAWVEKSPYNEKFAKEIYSWWPNAKCIHVIRDPRDNYASYRRKHPDWQAEFFAINWRQSTRIGYRNLKKYGQKQYFILRYEDLVQSTDQYLFALCRFLNIEDHASLRRPSRAGINWPGNSMFNEQFQKISAAPLGRWRQVLKSQDAQAIVSLTSPWLKKLTYPFLSPQ